MKRFTKVLVALMLSIAVVCAAGCTKDPDNGGNNNGTENGGGGVDPQTYIITTSANPVDGGTVSGGGTYNEGASVTLRANTNTNYTFDHWQDGNTSNPRTITVTSNATYTAYFTYNGGNGSGGVDPQSYTITTTANPVDGGMVSGGGTYNEGASVTLRANANTNYTFDHWQDGSSANPRTITVTSNATYTAYFTYNGGSGGGSGNGNANGHAYVDLGLPSGLLWATCNVGADMPEAYGDYFAWGETQPKSVYNWNTYQYYEGIDVTKYTGSDGLTTLLPEDDAATTNWGGDWRMPTKAQWQELLVNTTNVWTTQNGVYGRKFTASNGNSLFLPAAGYRTGSSLYNDGELGHYWSSSLLNSPSSPGYPKLAWGIYFISDYCYKCTYRYYGLSVRAVLPASKN